MSKIIIKKLIHEHAEIAASDRRIKKALNILTESDRGRAALQGFKAMMTNGASGLDSFGIKALVTLSQEVLAGRRSFLELIQMPSPRTDKMLIALLEDEVETKECSCAGLPSCCLHCKQTALLNELKNNPTKL